MAQQAQAFIKAWTEEITEMTGMTFVGIDPGLDGAVGAITPKGIEIDCTPTFIVHGAKKNRREYDLAAMAGILTSIRDARAVRLVCLELVHSMPEQGVASSFNFGRGLGLWEGLLCGLGLPYQKVSPQRWKGLLLDGMPKGKGASLVVAKQLFPSVRMDRVKDHGIADALLLAEYARRTTGGTHAKDAA